MKCPHCQSEWKVSSGLSVTVQECPFCHKSLLPQPGEADTMEGVLRSIRDVYGVETLKSGKILLSYFKDLAPKMKKERKMLAEFVDAGGPGTLFAAVTKPESEQRIAVEKMVLCLTEEYLMAENFAKTVCTTFFTVISGKTSAPQPVQPPPPAPVAKPAKQPKLEYDPSLFEITPDGTLVRYLGRGNEVTVPEGVKRIGKEAFAFAELKRIAFPESLTHIDDDAFMAGLCANDRLNLPSGLTYIGERVFFDCKFTGVNLPASLRYMGYAAFMGCSELQEVVIPGSLEAVPLFAFLGCTKLKRVIIQPGVRALESESFSGCTMLQSVTVPASLTEIDWNVFDISDEKAPNDPDRVQIIFSEPWKDPGKSRFEYVKNIRF